MTQPVLRIHPAIGLARVGNSDDYYLAPETSAGMDQGDGDLTGGLPIRPGTENQPISDQDLRDGNGALKRQAQRFRIYQYLDPEAASSYPYQGKVEEITIGSTVDGKKVTDIFWTVHLANKKANCWVLEESVDPPAGSKPQTSSLAAFNDGQSPPLRNKDFGNGQADDPERLQKLVVDAGPRVIHGAGAQRISFDASSTPAYYQEGQGITSLPDYPVSYPSDHFPKLNSPSGTPVEQLGAVETDAEGRLVVLGGQGTASGWYQQNGEPYGLVDDVNNDGWFDDTADGPVTATLQFDDGSTQQLSSTAWVVSTDPAYAPQIRNVVSLWDEVYDTWLCCFGLDSSIYQGSCFPTDDSGFKKGYQPSFPDDVAPILVAAGLQMYTTALNEKAINAHSYLHQMTADSTPYPNIMSFIRNPYAAGGEFQTGEPLMPLALGDTEVSYLVLTKTQYFFLGRWAENQFEKSSSRPLTAGELLDKNVLTNCLGGRFSPGIDLTFIVRDTAFYDPQWQDPSIGPFRPYAATLDYSQATKSKPFLGVGYFPERPDSRVEPGDVCKFMALPWHTDYNSCATHLPDPNPGGDVTDPSQVYDGRNTTLLWSWPAQRPVSVYAYKDLGSGGELPEQRFSVRGQGTQSIPGPDNGVWPAKDGQGTGPDGAFFQIQQVGRFQERRDMLENWQEIGTVIQAPAIEGYPQTFDQGYYLEVESRMSDVSDVVEPYPNVLTEDVEPTS